MRAVIYTDRNGMKRRVLVRDGDDDLMAEFGLPAGPPSMDDFDCEVMKREINNLLVDNGLFTWQDIQKSPIGLNVVTTVVKRHLSALFHLQAERDKEMSEISQNK